jgi:hypothetical protein
MRACNSQLATPGYETANSRSAAVKTAITGCAGACAKVIIDVGTGASRSRARKGGAVAKSKSQAKKPASAAPKAKTARPPKQAKLAHRSKTQ